MANVEITGHHWDATRHILVTPGPDGEVTLTPCEVPGEPCGKDGCPWHRRLPYRCGHAYCPTDASAQENTCPICAAGAAQ